MSELEVDVAKTWPELVQETRIMADVLAHLKEIEGRGYLVGRLGDLAEAMTLKILLEAGEYRLEAQR